MVGNLVLLSVALPTPDPTSLPPAPPSREDQKTAVDRQLSVLYGESLIGPWPELATDPERTGRVARRRTWPWWLGVVALAVAVVLAGRALVESGLERRSAEQSSVRVDRLRMSIEDGHIDHAAELVDLLWGQTPSLDPDDPNFDQLLRAEAAAYRYFDAKPERFDRIWPHLRDGDAGATSAARRIAYLTVLCREERAQHLAELRQLQLELPNDAEVYYLVASSQEHRGNVAAAREAYRRSEALGPAWLSHRFDQMEFERQHDDADAAAEVAAGMLRSDPNSPWSRFAASLVAISVPPQDADAGAPRSPPVAVFQIKLAQGVQAASKGQTSQAEGFIDAAVKAISGGTPFMLDAFDYLAARKSWVLARRLTQSAQWPAQSSLAVAKQQQLAEASAER